MMSGRAMAIVATAMNCGVGFQPSRSPVAAMIPAVAVPAGFYASGLPFGLEFSARPWTDGDLLSIAYAWEQATHLRQPPTLVEKGLVAVTKP